MSLFVHEAFSTAANPIVHDIIDCLTHKLHKRHLSLANDLSHVSVNGKIQLHCRLCTHTYVLHPP